MKHKASWIAGLFLAGGVVLFALAVRGKENPEGELPQQSQVTPAASTWTEAATPKSVTTPPPSASSMTGDRQDSTQMVTYEDETTTVTSIAENLTKEEASKDRPTAPPETKDDLTDPDKVPSYEPEDGDEGNNSEGSTADRPVEMVEASIHPAAMAAAAEHLATTPPMRIPDRYMIPSSAGLRRVRPGRMSWTVTATSTSKSEPWAEIRIREYQKGMSTAHVFLF